MSKCPSCNQPLPINPETGAEYSIDFMLEEWMSSEYVAKTYKICPSCFLDPYLQGEHGIIDGRNRKRRGFHC